MTLEQVIKSMENAAATAKRLAPIVQKSPILRDFISECTEMYESALRYLRAYQEESKKEPLTFADLQKEK